MSSAVHSRGWSLSRLKLFQDGCFGGNVATVGHRISYNHMDHVICMVTLQPFHRCRCQALRASKTVLSVPLWWRLTVVRSYVENSYFLRQTPRHFAKDKQERVNGIPEESTAVDKVRGVAERMLENWRAGYVYLSLLEVFLSNLNYTGRMYTNSYFCKHEGSGLSGRARI